MAKKYRSFNGIKTLLEFNENTRQRARNKPTLEESLKIIHEEARIDVEDFKKKQRALKNILTFCIVYISWFFTIVGTGVFTIS